MGRIWDIPPRNVLSPTTLEWTAPARGEQRASTLIGVRFARSNIDPSAQHVDGGGSEGHSNPFDPFTYDLRQRQLGLEDWSCT